MLPDYTHSIWKCHVHYIVHIPYFTPQSVQVIYQQANIYFVTSLNQLHNSTW